MSYIIITLNNLNVTPLYLYLNKIFDYIVKPYFKIFKLIDNKIKKKIFPNLKEEIKLF